MRTDKLASLLGVFALGFGLSACGGASAAPAASASAQAAGASPSAAGSASALYDQAKKEGAVVWYGQFAESQAKPVIDAFEKAFPGVAIKFSDVKPTEAMTQIQVQEHAKNVQIDVSGVTGTNTPALVDLKVADESIDWAKLGVPAELTDLSPGLVQDFSLGDLVVYNTNKVTAADAPKSWKDLLDPKWKGKLAVDGRGSFLDGIYLAPDWGETKALDYATQLAAQKPSYQTNLEQVLASVVSGQFELGTAVISQVLFAQQSGKPVGIASVSPVESSRHWLYVPKGAPHPAAAKLFVSWMASKDGQASLANSYNSALPLTTKCPGSGSPLQKALCGNHVEWVTAKDLTQLRGVNEFTDKARKIFGTYTGA